MTQEEYCRKGHPRTPENTTFNHVTGYRACKVCATEIKKRLYAREKEMQRIAFEKIKADR